MKHIGKGRHGKGAGEGFRSENRVLFEGGSRE
jgi:hypothetical protein